MPKSGRIGPEAAYDLRKRGVFFGGLVLQAERGDVVLLEDLVDFGEVVDAGFEAGDEDDIFVSAGAEMEPGGMEKASGLFRGEFEPEGKLDGRVARNGVVGIRNNLGVNLATDAGGAVNGWGIVVEAIPDEFDHAGGEGGIF